jgi:hypothetical protein
MRRWFWIIALGFSAFVLAALATVVLVWSAWTHELSFQLVLGGIGMLGFAAYALQLCFRRVDGPLPEVKPVDPSIFVQSEDQ